MGRLVKKHLLRVVLLVSAGAALLLALLWLQTGRMADVAMDSVAAAYSTAGRDSELSAAQAQVHHVAATTGSALIGAVVQAGDDVGK